MKTSFADYSRWARWNIVNSGASALSFGILTVVFINNSILREIFGMFTIISILGVIGFVLLERWKRRK